jgi:tRNA(Ile2) C34 agmatinyltransferase TiaS
MDGSFLPIFLGTFFGLLVTFAVVSPVRRCPNCGQAFPRLRMPQSFGEALSGGWRCTHCGTKADRFARQVEANQ